MSYNTPRLLKREDNIEHFSCRSQNQTNWLRRTAHQAAAANTSKVFVTTDSSDDTVVAYYGWCMTAIPIEAASEQ